MTPEVQAGDVARGSLFLNVTGEVLAAPGEVLKIIPVVQSKEFILWQDRQFDGGGIFARAKKVFDPDTEEFRYAWDKPNQTFLNKIKGILPVEWHTMTYVDENAMDKFGSANINDPDSHPAATAHHNYLVVLPDHNNLVAAMSLSSSQVKRAKDFNFMLNSGDAPIFSRLFAVTTYDDMSKAGDEFKNINFKPAGFVEDPNVFSFTKGLFERFSAKGFTVDQSDLDSGDTKSKF